jgi:hypothetical protein
MKKLLLTTAALCALAAPAHATLHMCYLTGCTTFDKVSISGATQPSGSDLSGWGVSSAKGGESGGLYIAMLARTNESEVVLPTLTGTLNGSPLTIESWANEGAFGSQRQAFQRSGHGYRRHGGRGVFKRNPARPIRRL